MPSHTEADTCRKYVLPVTPSQSLRIVYADASAGNVCMEYFVDDLGEQSFTRFAIFEKDSKLVNYDLGQKDIENHCSMTEVDLTKIAKVGAR